MFLSSSNLRVAEPDWCGVREAVGGTARLERGCGSLGPWTAAARRLHPVLLDLLVL